jgi:GTPase SAR1 family protein
LALGPEDQINMTSLHLGFHTRAHQFPYFANKLLRENKAHMGNLFEKEQKVHHHHHGVYEPNPKILLLGASGSGKSTFFRQIKLINSKGFTEEYSLSHISTIHRQIIENCQLILRENSLRLEEEYQLSSESREIAKQILQENKEDVLTPIVGDFIKKLWSDPAFKLTFETCKHEFLVESTKYFLNKITEVCNPNYVPTKEDLLKMYVRTNFVRETFQNGKFEFNLYDIQGNRDKRKKDWIHLFDSVSVVLFFIAISEYDQVYSEGDPLSILHESFDILQETSSSEHLSKVPFILLLNKQDLFDAKFSQAPLQNYFNDFAGESAADAYEYFVTRARSRMPTGKSFYHHVITATITADIKMVFSEVKDMINKRSNGDLGFM